MRSGQMVTYLLKLFLFSFLISTSPAINITHECWEDVTEFLSDLNAEKPKPYAIKMYDSVGKYSSNILNGNVDRLGSYTECISAEAPSGKFRGQYCKLQLQQGRIDYYNGICVPDSCQEEEITALATLGIFKFKSTSFLLPLPSLFALNASISFNTVARCAKDLSTIDAFTGVCLFISVLFIILPVAGTMYNADLWRKAKDNKQPSDANYGSTSSTQKHTSTSKTETTQTDESLSGILPLVDGSKQSSLDCIMKCFSLQKNLPAIWITQSSQEDSLALNGLRSLSLLWIISGHTSQMTAWQNLDNPLEWEAKVPKNPVYIYSRSGPFYLGVDTFFIISGLLSSWSFLKMVNCSGKDINFYIALKYLWNRFLRLQPLHMYSVCLLVALYSITPWGALWEFLKLEVENCRRMWWTNLLLINNFIAGPELCTGWTWYLANDFQFYFITPLLVFLSSRRKCWLVISGTFLFLATFTATALISFFYRLPVANPHDMRQMSTVMYFLEYYSKPYCRYGPFLVGVFLGLFMNHHQPSILRTKVQACLGWLCAMISMSLVIALAYTLGDSHSFYSPVIAIYQAVHRTLWAIAVGWIIFACEEGYGGFINTILSWRVWTVVARISYACYLVHPMMILLYNGLQETLIHYSDINLFYLFLGHCLMTFMVGLALRVMVETPLQKLRTSLGSTHQHESRL
ncbi:O-acyltransferase like protein [Thamnophis elegans]|uniref:O-acyltransferase like protein n=1 Tax=Thamnophis elegans TaxID=35005 RepID=UPI001377A977|nr:O-acyltransferase like protein [Thamnophis elegans]